MSSYSLISSCRSIGSATARYCGHWANSTLIRKEENFWGTEKIHSYHRLGRKQAAHMTSRAGGTWLSGLTSGHMLHLVLLSIAGSSLKGVFFCEIEYSSL